MADVHMALLRTPRNGTVRVVERGLGTPVVFLHSGVGSAGEWREVFSVWPTGYRDLWDVLFTAPITAPITAASLASVAVPVHVIEGSATSIVDRAICDAVLRSVRQARRSVIEGAGHMMPLTHPGELTRALV